MKQSIPTLCRLEKAVSHPLRTVLLTFALLTLTACAGQAEYSPFLQAEPAPGEALTRAPRTLRLYFNALPDVERSSLRLIGASGEHQLRGLHTMAADDLMIEIMDAVTPGTYTVEWSTVVADDPEQYSGSYEFTLGE